MKKNSCKALAVKKTLASEKKNLAQTNSSTTPPPTPQKSNGPPLRSDNYVRPLQAKSDQDVFVSRLDLPQVDSLIFLVMARYIGMIRN